MYKIAAPSWYGKRPITILGTTMPYSAAISLLDSVTRLATETDDDQAKAIRRAVLDQVGRHDKALDELLSAKGPATTEIPISRAVTQINSDIASGKLLGDAIAKAQAFAKGRQQAAEATINAPYGPDSGRLVHLGTLARSGQLIQNRHSGGNFGGLGRLAASTLVAQGDKKPKEVSPEYTKYQLGQLDRNFPDSKKLDFDPIDYSAAYVGPDGSTSPNITSLPDSVIKSIRAKATKIRDIRLGKVQLHAVKDTTAPEKKPDTNQSLLQSVMNNKGKTALIAALLLGGGYGAYKYYDSKKKKSLEAKKIEEELALEQLRRRSVLRNIAIAAGATTGLGVGGYAAYRRLHKNS